MRLDSNQQPLRYQQSALTIELRTNEPAKWDRTIHSGRGNVIPCVRHPRLNWRHGSRGRPRTCDLPVNGRALYQLSYTQMVGQTIRRQYISAGFAPCWWLGEESNPRRGELHSPALPTELPSRWRDKPYGAMAAPLGMSHVSRGRGIRTPMSRLMRPLSCLYSIPRWLLGRESNPD